MKYTIALTAIALALSTPALAQNKQKSSNNVQSGATAALIQESSGPDLGNQVPPTYAPGLDSGTNNCAVSASAGGSGSGFGISFGASIESEDCQRRQWYTLMMKSQRQGVAWAIACQTNFVREAAADTPGMTCPDQKTTEELQTASTSDEVPGYCDDGGFASEGTIRRNCPNAEELLDD